MPSAGSETTGCLRIQPNEFSGLDSQKLCWPSLGTMGLHVCLLLLCHTKRFATGKDILESCATKNETTITGWKLWGTKQEGNCNNLDPL